MKLAKFWARETSDTHCRGWSNDSMAAAERHAAERAQKMKAARDAGHLERSQYEYAMGPLPEETLREFPGASGEPAAVLTRNSYGAVVLNTAEMMFVDIDLPEEKSSSSGGIGSMFRSLFGKAQEEPSNIQSPEAVAMARIEQACRAQSDLSFRVYKTCGGLRLILTSRTMDPRSSESQQLLNRLAADPLYCKLCKAQESYRARLTPKPWRCDLSVPPASFPYVDGKAREAFQGWLENYTSTIGRYATCQFVKTVGPAITLDGFSELIRVHDQETKATSGQALA